MKKEHLDSVGCMGIGGYGTAATPRGAGKMVGGLDEETDAGMDELLAALGYKVRSSDMADVAQKLEQLEMAIGSSAAQDDALLAHLATDTVHYNPSDLSNWLESMLSELGSTPLPMQPVMHSNSGGYDMSPPPPMSTQSSSAFFDPSDTLLATDSSAITSTEFYTPPAPISLPDFTIRKSNALANRAPVYGLESPTDNGSRDRKRMRTSSSCSSSRGGSVGVNNVHSSPAIGSLPSSVEVSSAMPMVMVDTQEVGVRLVHALMACAEAVQEENYKAADILVKQISMLASSQGGAMRKVAGYFAEALARRIYRVVPQDCSISLDSTFSDILQMHFYESCPYLKFAHFTANQAILEAFAGCRRVHVIDFSMKQGMQWPALMQALALRPGGPPSFRLTGIGPPQLDNTDALQQVGWKLAQLAETIHVDFEYRGFVANNLADLEPYMLESLSPVHNSSGELEVVAINSIFELHRLLAWPGALEKVLSTVRAVKPRIVTVVEQEASHNTGPFMERFTEALHYYSTMFDSLESGDINGDGQHDLMMSEVYLGRQICNVISAEWSERTERHETLTQWRARMGGAGFEPVHLGSNAFKQASMLLALFSGGEGYRVEEKEGCLTLGWHTRPLIATSAWRVVGPADSLSANASSDSRQSSSAPTLVLPSS